MSTRHIVSLLFIVSLEVFLVACSSSYDLTSVAVAPSPASVQGIGAQQQFTASAYYQRSSHAPKITDVTSQASWSSSNTGVATINSSGVATAVAVGTTTITATYQTFSSTATLTVTTTSGGSGPRTLTFVSLIPNSQPLNTLGETAQFIAVGTYSAAPTTESLAGQVTWASSDTTVATVDSSGLATAIGCGASSCVTTITASATAQDGSTIIGTATLTVTPGVPQPTRALSAITILPGANTQTLYKVGETSQFVAIGTFTASPVTVDLTDSVTWASSDVDLATIDSAGLATSLSCATPSCVTNITASSMLGENNSLVIGTSNLTILPNGGSSNLPSLTVYLVGANAGTGKIISSPAGIDCTVASATGCTAYFPQGSNVTLTATPGTPQLAGWSAQCVPNTANPCTVTMNTNQTVGAIFN